MKYFFIGFLVTLLISYLIVAFYMWDLLIITTIFNTQETRFYTIVFLFLSFIGGFVSKTQN